MGLHADAFQRFTVLRKKDLQRIARATRGEHGFDDVVHEAFIMATSFQAAEGHVDLLEPNCQHKLLAHLYQHLVRYTELNVRHAVRLDHAPGGPTEDGDVHPLIYLLASDDGCDPLRNLLECEEQAAREGDLQAHGSLAAAYVHLLRQCDNKMSMVADHLRISISYAYRRCAIARWLAAHMTHIPMPVADHFVPMPWRRFRLRRPQVQLSFNFEDELPI